MLTAPLALEWFLSSSWSTSTSLRCFGCCFRVDRFKKVHLTLLERRRKWEQMDGLEMGKSVSLNKQNWNQTIEEKGNQGGKGESDRLDHLRERTLHGCLSVYKWDIVRNDRTVNIKEKREEKRQMCWTVHLLVEKTEWEVKEKSSSKKRESSLWVGLSSANAVSQSRTHKHKKCNKHTSTYG